MTSSEPVHVVLVTAPDAETGARLARDLVAHGLAACVNLVPGVRSIYRWQGALQEDAEILLSAKTRAGLVPALAERKIPMYGDARPGGTIPILMT